MARRIVIEIDDDDLEDMPVDAMLGIEVIHFPNGKTVGYGSWWAKVVEHG